MSTKKDMQRIAGRMIAHLLASIVVLVVMFHAIGQTMGVAAAGEFRGAIGSMIIVVAIIYLIRHTCYHASYNVMLYGCAKKRYESIVRPKRGQCKCR